MDNNKDFQNKTQKAKALMNKTNKTDYIKIKFYRQQVKKDRRKYFNTQGLLCRIYQLHL